MDPTTERQMTHLRLLDRTPRQRRLFIVGRLGPRATILPTCTQNDHRGPLLNEEKYLAAGAIWTGCGECAACGSTVSRAQMRAS